MKNAEIIKASISLVDEIFKNKGRQNFIGTLITGIGLTVTSLGICVLLNKPGSDELKLKQCEKTE